MSAETLAQATHDVPVVIPPMDETARRQWNEDSQKCSSFQENPDLAIEHCTRAMNSPHLVGLVLAILLSNRGAAYQFKGDYDRAIQDYGRALQAESGFRSVLTERGAAYASKGDYHRAIQDFNDAILLLPDDARAFYGRGYVHRRQEDYDRAIQDYDTAIRLDPKIAVVYSERGYVYARKGDDARAIQDYDEAIRLEPGDTLSLLRRGRAYFRKGSYERAIRDYDEIIRIDPKDARALQNKGRALFYLERFGDARGAFTKGVELEPQDAYGSLWLYLARTREGHNGKDELAANAKNLDVQQWPWPIVRFYLGTAAPKDLLRSAESLDPKKSREQRCEAYFYLGEQALMRGDRQEAIKLFQATLDTGVTNFIEYEAAQIELQRLSR
jgi:lipoprotein NlpI